MDILLIAGLWLEASAWTDVVAELEQRGHRPQAVALPGVDDGRTTAALQDQLAAVVAAVDAVDRPLVVGHSAASTLAWLAADRRADSVAAVVMIGGFPSSPGATYADFFPLVDGAMPFPGWEPFEGADSADLDEPARERLETGAVPVPAGVSTAVVEFTDDRRFGIPVVLVCPEYSPDQAQAWIDAGDLPELSATSTVTLVDIDSGHWPMLTRPGELARILDAIAQEV